MNIEDINKALTNLSFDDLKKVQKGVDKMVEGFAERKRQEALAAMEATAKEHGFSVSELTGGKIKKAKGPKSDPKYAHPENPELTWTGMGRLPGWMKKAIGDGRQKDEFLIK